MQNPNTYSRRSCNVDDSNNSTLNSNNTYHIATPSFFEDSNSDHRSTDNCCDDNSSSYDCCNDSSCGSSCDCGCDCGGADGGSSYK
jgi:hypothetical protein